MAVSNFTCADIPGALLDLLEDHLPYSLPLLRRLRFAVLNNSRTTTSRVIFVSDATVPAWETASGQVGPFAAAYLDPAAGPETQMWIYSTLEDGGLSQEDEETCSRQMESLVIESKRIGREYAGELAYSGRILIGTLHSSTRDVIERRGFRLDRRSVLGYDKWLFKVRDLPAGELGLLDSMHWSPATADDCLVAISRTDLPRQLNTLTQLPSMTLKLQDGTPVAWAFLGMDGSLTSLHCEEPYRGKGFARAVAARLFRSASTASSGPDWCTADVSPDNLSSAAVCKSLNGLRSWHLDWVLLHI